MVEPPSPWSITNLWPSGERSKALTLDARALRKALEQKTKDWRKVLRSEPRLARMLLRRLVGPITLWKDEPLPRWLKRDAVRWRAENRVAGELNVQPDQSPRGSRIS